MVFLQIYITNPRYSFYQLGLSGTFLCKIIDIRYTSNNLPHPPGDQNLILISSAFNFPNNQIFISSSVSTLLLNPGVNFSTLVDVGPPPQYNIDIKKYVYAFTNIRGHNIGNSPSCAITITDGIDFTIVDLDKGELPNNFKNCIITLELTT